MSFATEKEPSKEPRFNVRTMGILLTLVGAVLMSFDPVFIRFSGVSGFDTAFLFGLFTAISMPIFIQVREKQGLVATLRQSGWPVVLSGLLMLGSASSLVLSIKNTSVANTFIILSTYPALSAVFGRILLGEVTRRATWIAIAAVMVGIGIAVSGSVGSINLFGDALAFFAVICVSLNQTLLRKYKNVSGMASVGMGGFFLAIVMAFFANPSSYSLDTWLIMGAMGLFTAPFGRVLPRVAIRYIPAPEVGLIMMIQVVIGPLFAFGFFGEIPPMASFLGGAIILVTILIYAISSIRSAQ